MIFDSLDEGIMLVQDNAIVFVNNVFTNLLSKLNRDTMETEKLKMFKKHGSNSETSYNVLDIIKQYMTSGESQRDQIYQMLDEGETFRYVSLRVKSIISTTLTSCQSDDKNKESYLI